MSWPTARSLKDICRFCWCSKQDLRTSETSVSPNSSWSLITCCSSGSMDWRAWRTYSPTSRLSEARASSLTMRWSSLRWFIWRSLASTTWWTSPGVPSASRRTMNSATWPPSTGLASWIPWRIITLCWTKMTMRSVGTFVQALQRARPTALPLSSTDNLWSGAGHTATARKVCQSSLDYKPFHVTWFIKKMLEMFTSSGGDKSCFAKAQMIDKL